MVEGTWSRDGYFQASTIMAKHSEEYKAPHDASQAGYKELLKTLAARRGQAVTPELGLRADGGRARAGRSTGPAPPR